MGVNAKNEELQDDVRAHERITRDFIVRLEEADRLLRECLPFIAKTAPREQLRQRILTHLGTLPPTPGNMSVSAESMAWLREHSTPVVPHPLPQNQEDGNGLG